MAAVELFRDGFPNSAKMPELLNKEKGHKKVFHSFRHTFDTRLRHRYVETTMIDELMGHAVEKLSMGTYGEQYSIQQRLSDAIMKLDYDLVMIS